PDNERHHVRSKATPRCELLDILSGMMCASIPKWLIANLPAGRADADAAHSPRKPPLPGKLPAFLGEKGRILSDAHHAQRSREPARLARRVAAFVYGAMLLAALLFMFTLAV